MEDTAREAGIAQAVEAYREGLLTANKAQLEALCMDQLTYGHSSGLLQTKAEFIADATSGKTTWTSIRFEGATNRVVGDTAISRCIFVGENASAGKTNALRFAMVMVWHKQDGEWKLLVRQGYKV
ncbi:MAG: nuclear transport factor 2 family protein [Acetobacteraceae bacterium]